MAVQIKTIFDNQKQRVGAIQRKAFVRSRLNHGIQQGGVLKVLENLKQQPTVNIIYRSESLQQILKQAATKGSPTSLIFGLKKAGCIWLLC
ncbi:MAG: hypothetical protein U1E78_09770 [Gammaproteobacteria bacterium]